MPLAGFEPAIPASERLQTHALERLATGIGIFYQYKGNFRLSLGNLSSMMNKYHFFARRIYLYIFHRCHTHKYRSPKATHFPKSLQTCNKNNYSLCNRQQNKKNNSLFLCVIATEKNSLLPWKLLFPFSW